MTCSKRLREQNIIKSDFPTCSKESLHLLNVMSDVQWMIQSVDIKSAFLQSHSIDRAILLKPRKEADES